MKLVSVKTLSECRILCVDVKIYECLDRAIGKHCIPTIQVRIDKRLGVGGLREHSIITDSK